MSAPPPEPQPDIYYKRSRFSTRLPWDRLYTASHFWVRETEPGVWQVGLTKFAARMLGEVVDLAFDVQDDEAIEVGQTIGSLEGFKARTELYAVASGRFAGGNPALAQSLEALDTDRYGAGWLYLVRGVPDADARDAGGYAHILDATIDRMRDHL